MLFSLRVPPESMISRNAECLRMELEQHSRARKGNREQADKEMSDKVKSDNVHAVEKMHTIMDLGPILRRERHAVQAALRYFMANAPAPLASTAVDDGPVLRV